MRLGRTVAAGLVGVGLVFGLSGEITAQTDMAVLVKERQDNMKKMGGALFRDIGRVVRGENPNISEAVASAAALDELAQGMVKQFPAKTDRAGVQTSRAKPEVWDQRSDFEAAANKFAAETSKLSIAVKSGNLDAIKAQFGPTTQACGGCHEAKPDAGGKFRFEKQ